MSSKRRVGVPSAATTEAARRQLMQPVMCWERVWVTPESAPVGSTLKVWKWVRTEKTQQFTDDDGTVDEPLAPLPDEPETIEVDEEEQEDNNAAPEEGGQTDSAAPTAPATEPQTEVEDNSKPVSPKPLDELSMPHSLDETGPQDEALLDVDLNPVDPVLQGMDEVDIPTEQHEDIMQLDLGDLGPDGMGLESSDDLAQLVSEDALLGGGPIMDETSDPFSQIVDIPKEDDHEVTS